MIHYHAIGTPYYPPCHSDADCYQSHVCDTDGHCAPVPYIDQKNPGN